MSRKPGTAASGMGILIVEDSPTQAVQLEYFLDKAGFCVQSVRNGREALDWLNQHKPAMVISDVVMPDVDGYELCRRIKTDEDLEDIPVILLTSLSDAGDVLKGLECGADNFIVKPYDKGYLLSFVQRVCRNGIGAREEKPQATLDVVFAGQKYPIASTRLQILNILISTYGTAVKKNLELVRAQNELRALNEQLEEKVKERTAALTAEIAERRRVEEELRDYSTKLERSNKELEEFAFVAAHDLQEPLRKIQTFSQRVVTKYRDLLDDKGTDYLVRLQNAANRMQALIRSLLKYSRVAMKPNTCAAIDLNELVQEALIDLNLRVEETGAIIEVGYLPAIEADETQMHQLFQNLIGNALKFRGEEKPVIKIHSAECSDGSWQIFVEDNGIGFDEKYLNRIFAPFQRLHDPKVYEGTGIGLAICRKIVEQHGGSIVAKSAPGKGSTFIITLPAIQSK